MGGARRIEAQELVERHTEDLANNIVERHIDGRFRGGIEPDDLIELLENIFERERIVAEVAGKESDAGKHGFKALTIILGGRGFTIAGNFVVVHLNDDIRRGILYSREMRNGVVSFRSIGRALMCSIGFAFSFQAYFFLYHPILA